ncbi:hypothetical protein PV11_06440 [Exophiala sideris]|uniref:Impact N-terminal domain-containing protein n=1 Tax=Exophiala sideris TaxID=1016849 RepID=A0A0D1VRW0_9EURO|nr:hypothetical protein PV11_06440 [Exophiala sideris]
MSMSQKRPFSQDADEDSDSDQVFRSSPILDRSSTFIAHFHPLGHTNTTLGGKPVPLTSTVKTLQSHPDLASADHRMVAWRRPSTQRTLAPSTVVGVSHAIYTTGSDDDGEKYAGKKLERVLIDLDVQGTVVVARWYGGIMLGPVRFTHIETVAREAIMMWKAQQDHDSAKRQKLQQDAADEATRARLVKVLSERDNSIVVLRGLLAEKTSTATAKPEATQTEAADASSQTQTQPLTQTMTSPSTIKKIDYSVMPLQTLRQLEKARDATLAFILKQIDKAEEEEKKRRSVQESAGVTDGDTRDEK